MRECVGGRGGLGGCGVGASGGAGVGVRGAGWGRAGCERVRRSEKRGRCELQGTSEYTHACESAWTRLCLCGGVHVWDEGKTFRGFLEVG
jgi:hypothetical protein